MLKSLGTFQKLTEMSSRTETSPMRILKSLGGILQESQRIVAAYDNLICCRQLALCLVDVMGSIDNPVTTIVANELFCLAVSIPPLNTISSYFFFSLSVDQTSSISPLFRFIFLLSFSFFFLSAYLVVSLSLFLPLSVASRPICPPFRCASSTK